MKTAAGEHRALAGSLGVAPEAADRLARYLDLLAAWNERVNLTAARTAATRLDLLVRPVVPFASRLAPGTLLDIGSGNGSPGLVLAALRPDIQATLLEPRARRWAFLREAARAMEVKAEVLRCRHDGYPGLPADTVTVRALRLPAAALVPLVKPGGRLLVFGTAPDPHAALRAEDSEGGTHSFRRA